MLPGGGKGILLVTSSEQGEGKSFVSLNLAYSIALMRKRTVLIDLDCGIRKLLIIWGFR